VRSFSHVLPASAIASSGAFFAIPVPHAFVNEIAFHSVGGGFVHFVLSKQRNAGQEEKRNKQANWKFSHGDHSLWFGISNELGIFN